ncbi:MAG: peptidoglycan DD-metalloendopeptidase family protein [Clostridiales Family XIII bacterium]|jgi:murein DD-endopeptidase MepM/ murein hydrolase activator NlpD|nr:peptidoglycan DD-metalloendopeptidase family protein [Clostridiales Family XIII bacterium]
MKSKNFLPVIFCCFFLYLLLVACSANENTLTNDISSKAENPATDEDIEILSYSEAEAVYVAARNLGKTPQQIMEELDRFFYDWIQESEIVHNEDGEYYVFSDVSESEDSRCIAVETNAYALLPDEFEGEANARTLASVWNTDAKRLPDSSEGYFCYAYAFADEITVRVYTDREGAILSGRPNCIVQKKVMDGTDPYTLLPIGDSSDPMPRPVSERRGAFGKAVSDYAAYFRMPAVRLRNRMTPGGEDEFGGEIYESSGARYIMHRDINGEMFCDLVMTSTKHLFGDILPDEGLRADDLKERGLYGGAIDGVFDDRLTNAVNTFKDQMRLSNTGAYKGKVGRTTWECLGLSLGYNEPYFAPLTRPVAMPLPEAAIKEVSSEYLDTHYHDHIHMGIDIPAPRGTPIFAVAPGTVTKVENQEKQTEEEKQKGRGKYVRVEHVIDGRKITAIYQHNDKNSVSVGDRVNVGDKIAEAGNTGGSSGPHLHIEFIDENGNNLPPRQILSRLPFDL